MTHADLKIVPVADRQKALYGIAGIAIVPPISNG